MQTLRRDPPTELLSESLNVTVSRIENDADVFLSPEDGQEATMTCKYR
jgi:hypothetical protein